MARARSAQQATHGMAAATPSFSKTAQRGKQEQKSGSSPLSFSHHCAVTTVPPAPPLCACTGRAGLAGLGRCPAGPPGRRSRGGLPRKGRRRRHGTGRGHQVGAGGGGRGRSLTPKVVKSRRKWPSSSHAPHTSHVLTPAPPPSTRGHETQGNCANHHSTACCPCPSLSASQRQDEPHGGPLDAPAHVRALREEVRLPAAVFHGQRS